MAIAAIIAGNAPNDHVDRLREFWMQVTSAELSPGAGNTCLDFARGEAVHQRLNQMSVGFATASGARGFFKARPVRPFFQSGGKVHATMQTSQALEIAVIDNFATMAFMHFYFEN